MEKHIDYSPEYLSFKKRVWLHVNVYFIIYILANFFSVLYFKNTIFSFILVLIFTLSIAVFIIQSCIYNKYYLKRIQINKELNLLILEVYKYDKLYFEKSLDLNSIKVYKNNVSTKLPGILKMEIKDLNRNLIFKQYSTSGWNDSDFRIIIDFLKANI